MFFEIRRYWLDSGMTWPQTFIFDKRREFVGMLNNCQLLNKIPVPWSIPLKNNQEV
jgi:hypothetical protein